MAISEITLPIRGMTCGGCVRSVTRALEAVDGVEAVRVDLEGATAHLRADPVLAPRQRLVRAVLDAGFEVPGDE